ncbi:MAG: hypothetical protein GYA14_17745 [Ignavibacteria bacterium]|nr:hypothetical protein [Ignavibacteria bacterium]
MKPVKKDSKIILCSLILLFFSLSCNKNKLSEDVAVKVYVEKIVVEEKYATQPDSIVFYKSKIFSKYNTSEEALKLFMYDLGFKSEFWNNFFKKADEYLIQLKKDRVID